MRLHDKPDLLERLAAAYALGTLRGGARRRFETLAREHPAVRAAALLWQGRLQGLTELQADAAPPAAVWTRIENRLAADRAGVALERQRAAAQSRAPTGGWLQRLGVWNLVGTAGLATAVVVAILVGLVMEAGGAREARLRAQVATLQTQLQATPRVEYVAVLIDAKSAASMLLTVDGQGRQITLQRVGDYREATDRSLQLWALPGQGAPRSLGVLGTDAVLRLPAPVEAVAGVPTVAISLEPLGGVPSEGGPTGPVLFQGALIAKRS